MISFLADKNEVISRSFQLLMSNHLHNELRKEFQLERLILFSDAVFAIAITLLVIEIKIPGHEDLEKMGFGEVSDAGLRYALARLIPKFIGFLISFLLIGQYWIVHHRMFGYVINFTQRLIWLNILFLLAVALMPFSTGFYSEYSGKPVMTPIVFYTSNIAFLGLINFFMWKYLSNPKYKLTENLSPLLAKYSSFRAITVPVVFIICAFVYVKSPPIAAFIPISIPLILKIAFGPLNRRIIKEKSNHSA